MLNLSLSESENQSFQALKGAEVTPVPSDDFERVLACFRALMNNSPKPIRKSNRNFQKNIHTYFARIDITMITTRPINI
jgi:hypothetical protein